MTRPPRNPRRAYDAGGHEIRPMSLGTMREHGVRSVLASCQDTVARARSTWTACPISSRCPTCRCACGARRAGCGTLKRNRIGRGADGLGAMGIGPRMNPTLPQAALLTLCLPRRVGGKRVCWRAVVSDGNGAARGIRTPDPLITNENVCFSSGFRHCPVVTGFPLRLKGLYRSECLGVPPISFNGGHPVVTTSPSDHAMAINTTSVKLTTTTGRRSSSARSAF
jgi:hypothetical protein